MSRKTNINFLAIAQGKGAFLTVVVIMVGFLTYALAFVLLF